MQAKRSERKKKKRQNRGGKNYDTIKSSKPFLHFAVCSLVHTHHESFRIYLSLLWSHFLPPILLFSIPFTSIFHSFFFPFVSFSLHRFRFPFSVCQHQCRIGCRFINSSNNRFFFAMVDASKIPSTHISAFAIPWQTNSSKSNFWLIFLHKNQNMRCMH